jgi:hypothetical protein
MSHSTLVSNLGSSSDLAPCLSDHGSSGAFTLGGRFTGHVQLCD